MAVMLGVEALEDRSLPSLLLAVDGRPGSGTGWARTPGSGATVAVFFRDLPGPAVAVTRAALASLDRQFQRGHVGVRLVPAASLDQADVDVVAGGVGPDLGGTTTFPLAFAAGTFANGHLYFRWQGQIRIALNFAKPWYYGTAAAPPAGGVDFETAVMHELGHAIGLDHNPDPGDTMNAVLPPGVARRRLDPQDLRTLRQVYGSGPAP
jgi:hypothetical protein